LLLAAGAATADSLSVSPVRATLSAAAPIIALTVQNGGDDPAVVQLEAMLWSQSDGADRYEPTRDLIATPPIFTVPAHASQIVRVGLRRAADSRHELAYRLYLQEIPPPPPPDFVGMRVALRLGVPVFVAPLASTPAALHCEALRAADATLSVACRNDGSAHVRIVGLALSSAAGGPALMTRQVAADVHAGQSRAWVMQGKQVPAAGTPLHLTATTERGDVHADLLAP
jgi:fimbrial chaperone protein